MLTAFGTYWSIEGVGYLRESGESLNWPGDKLALIALIVVWFLLTRLLVAHLSRLRTDATDDSAAVML